MSKLKVGDQVRAVHFAVDREGTTDPDTGLIRDGAGDVISIDDNVTVPAGTLGVVDHIDGVGQAHVRWANGARLGLVPGKDKWALVRKVGE